ncbi:hypothetical protein EV360DRAFT_67813 [Lentinula raphanica]|nr:hypothetical protein EV360DRAFT_67813 [Lentinula raphanica]
MSESTNDNTPPNDIDPSTSSSTPVSTSNTAPAPASNTVPPVSISTAPPVSNSTAPPVSNSTPPPTSNSVPSPTSDSVPAAISDSVPAATSDSVPPSDAPTSNKSKGKGKAGRRSDWPQDELDLLSSHVDTYIRVEGSKTKFWDEFLPIWWNRFPEYKDGKRGLSEAQTLTKLKNWFRNQRTGSLGVSRSLFQPVIKMVNTVSASSAIKYQPLEKIFLKHPVHGPLVKAEATRTWTGGATKGDNDPQVKQEITEAREADFQRRKAEKKEAQEDGAPLSALSRDDLDLRQEKFSSIAAPFASSLAKSMDCNMLIIAYKVELDENGEPGAFYKTVSEGTVGGQKVETFDEDGFIKVFSNHILKFGQAQLAEAQRESAAVEDSTNAPVSTPSQPTHEGPTNPIASTSTVASAPATSDSPITAESQSNNITAAPLHPETVNSDPDPELAAPTSVAPPTSVDSGIPDSVPSSTTAHTPPTPPPASRNLLQIEDLEEDLQKEVLAMSPNSQRSRMRDLRHMDNFYLHREENMARHRAIFQGLGLGPDRMEELGMKIPKTQKKKVPRIRQPKPPPAGSTRRLRSTAKLVSEEPGSSSDPDSTITPASTSQLLEIPPSMAWLSLARKTLLDGLENQVFHALVDSFVELEVLYSSGADPINLSWVGRPGDVKLWIKNYQKITYTPSLISSSQSFSMEVISWWKNLVGNLRAPGINGLYSVLICIRWWILEEQKEGGPTATLTGFIAEVQTQIQTLIAQENDDGDVDTNSNANDGVNDCTNDGTNDGANDGANDCTNDGTNDGANDATNDATREGNNQAGSHKRPREEEADEEEEEVEDSPRPLKMLKQ